MFLFGGKWRNNFITKQRSFTENVIFRKEEIFLVPYSIILDF